MAQSKEHVTQMTANDLHKKGACILRHDGSKGSPCDYPWNGYQVSQTAARKGMYNKEVKPHHIDRDRANQDIYEAARKKKKRSDETRDLFQARLRRFIDGYRHGVRRVARPLANSPKAWFIGSDSPDPDNFKPRRHGGMGYHHPYFHNYHHMVPNGAIHEFIGCTENGTKKLFLLMTSLYNINAADNIVLLPKQSFVGRALGLPIHCPYGQRSHPTYSNSCQKTLSKISDLLQEVLDQGSPHRLNDSNVAVIKQEINLLEKKLLMFIKAMTPGESLDVPVKV
jgi:hypothetical protein